MFRHSLRAFGALALVAGLVACSGAPSDSDFESVIQASWSESAWFELQDVDVADSWAAGEGRWSAEVRFVLRATADAAEFEKTLEEAKRGAQGFGAMQLEMTGAAMRMQFGQFREGDEFEMTREITLAKSERGWRDVSSRGGSQVSSGSAWDD